MTNLEVVTELKKEIKPYIGKMAQSTFSLTCLKIENNLSKPKTVDKFFNGFGYFGEWNNYENKVK